ncbi:MAG: hypothetical protein Kow0025_08830 [Thermodesulfovibrionales bacterium]
MRRFLLALALLALSFPAAPAAGEAPEALPGKLLYETNSLYQYIAVREDEEKGERYIFNTKRRYMQGGMDVRNPGRLIFEYQRMSFIGLAFLDRTPADALFVGLGAGSMPMYFAAHWPGARVDVVEIDPDMLKVAREYFHFREGANMRVHLRDGRVFIKRTREKYDAVFLDAYKNDYIPFHLTTREFLAEVKNKLRPGGVVVANVTAPFLNKLFWSMIKTYAEVFPHLYVFRSQHSNNYVFVAALEGARVSEEAVARRAVEIGKAHGLDYDLGRAGWTYAHHSDLMDPAAKVLTDDFAPVNLYRFMKEERRR